MKYIRKPILCVILICIVFVYAITRGNVYWRVHREYPSATILISAEGNPNTTIDGSILRALGLNYYSPFEDISIHISDHPTPINFNIFKGMCVYAFRFDRCTITDIRPLLTLYQSIVSFFDCDISKLPADQQQCLQYQPEFNRHSISMPPDSLFKHSGGFGLSTDNFYP